MKQENGQREFGQDLTEVVLSRHQQKRLAYASGAPLEEDLHQQNRAISDNLYSQVFFFLKHIHRLELEISNNIKNVYIPATFYMI